MGNGFVGDFRIPRDFALRRFFATGEEFGFTAPALILYIYIHQSKAVTRASISFIEPPCSITSLRRASRAPCNADKI